MKHISTLLLFFCCFFAVSAKAQHINAHVNAGVPVFDTATNKLLIPNAFSPNNDGTNDFFKIANFTNQKLIEFKIFNRWGTILFTTTNPSSGWDGTYKNKKQPVGVYGYVIRIAYPDDIVDTYKGTLTLLR